MMTYMIVDGQKQLRVNNHYIYFLLFNITIMISGNMSHTHDLFQVHSLYSLFAFRSLEQTGIDSEWRCYPMDRSFHCITH